jgi:hypothetical protein
MKKFISKITAFIVPLLITLIIPVLFLFVSGENYKSIDDLVKSKHDYLIGYAYNEVNYRYLKQIELESRQPQQVIALGSSRVLQFRAKMFTKQFYNAGYTISSISDFAPFIKSNLENKKPEVLLIALDQWMFNENWDNLEGYSMTNKTWSSFFKKSPSIGTIYKVWSDLLSNKYGFEVLSSHEDNNTVKVGLNAFVSSKGFRKDGSIYYGSQIIKLLSNDSTANDFNYSDTFERIKEGNRRFQHGVRVNDKAIKALSDLLMYCKSMDIYVVAILPPFANDVNKKMKESTNFSYLDSIYDKSKEIFDINDFELWDMSNLTVYNSNDSETIDGFHGSEVAYLKMLIYMIENGSKLQDVSDIDKLKNDLSNKRNNYSVYPNE